MTRQNLENQVKSYFKNFPLDYSRDIKDLYEEALMNERNKISLPKFKEIIEGMLKGGKNSILERDGELLKINRNVFYEDSEIEEQKLYPPIKNWLYENQKIDAKILDQRTAKTKKGESDHWRYPDLIGINNYNISRNQDNLAAAIAAIANNSASPIIDISSFEVKLELTNYNIRSSFFQCLANSAWANRRFLVAEKIEERALNEFQRLSKVYNMGLIKLGIKKVGDSSWHYSDDTKLLQDCSRQPLDIEILYDLAIKWNDLKEWFEELKEKKYF